MNTISSFKCVVIGDNNLSILCAEHLLSQKHSVVSFISQSVENRDWANQKKIPCFSSTSCFLNSELSNETFDYLFSIVNFQVLPAKLLSLPLKLAINFHDSLLPRYAGLHATSWALLNEETEHGVSWHIMTKEVDAGELLVQERIPIAQQETAFTLNLKCHQQALISFEKLVQLLSKNQLIMEKQKLAQRTYFSRFLKPSRVGIIDWQTPGESIDSMCRALYFGHQQANTLGTPKFVIHDELYTVEHHKLVTQSGKKPGVISEMNNHYIQVATQSQDIQLLIIKDVEGNTVSITDLVHKHHLKKGALLINDNFVKATEQYCLHIAPHEEFWVKQFRELEPFDIPFTSYIKEGLFKNCSKTLNCSIPNGLFKELLKIYSNHNEKQIILSTFLAYFYRLNNYEAFSIAFSYPEIGTTNELLGLVANWVPLTIDMNPENKFQDIIATVSKHYGKIIQHRNFQNDLFYRYPDIGKPKIPIAIIFSNTGHYQSIKNSLIDIVIDAKTNEISIHFPNNYLSSVDKILNYFSNFLLSLCREKNNPIKGHSLLSEKEKTLLTITWNQTESIDLMGKTLGLEFEKKTAQTPNKTALVFEGKVLTYSELNTKVNQLACYIQGITAQKNTPIIIYLPRCVESVICMLAVLKSGNTYIPIIIETPLAKMEAIIKDCQAKIILTDSYFANQIESNFEKKLFNIIELDSEWENIERENTDNIPDYHSPNHIAYVLYTSGSTGEPKGVQITQRALMNFLLAINHEIGFSREDILLAITPFNFDISGLEIYLPLINGACCILASSNSRLDPQKIAHLITKYKVTIMQATPATWQMLIAIGWKNEQQIKVLCGGEELQAPLANQLLSTHAPLWNLYGPTETTIWSTAYRVKQVYKSTTPIGKPIANTLVYVLDKERQLVPIGVPGTLYIGGGGVAQGYLNKPELTSINFIPNPFSDKKDRLYNTGDQVMWLANGNLIYLCRKDNQVKIRGYRIELGEIETNLLNYPDVSQAVVLNKNSNQLVAFLVMGNNYKKDTFNHEHLLDYLKQKLLDYMVPNYFILLDKLPINTNGKIDKKALLTLPMTVDVDANKPKLAPITAEQKCLVRIWAELLGLNQQYIGINDNFFFLGGNSLLAVQVINRINASFSLNLNIATLFNHSTISDLENLIAKSAKTNLEFKPIRIKEPQILLDNQMRIWFLNKLIGNSAVYNISIAWELKGNLDYDALSKALTEIIKRQGIFRTRFYSIHGKPVQQLQPAELIEFTLKPEKLTERSNQEIKSYLKNLATEPFLVEDEFLFRFRLFKVAEDTHLLFICLHHLIADGWSLNVLYRELSLLYKSFSQKSNPILPTIPMQYIEYCAWQKAVSDNPIYEKQMEYWKKKLENLNPLELPTDYPRPLVQTYQGDSIHFNISAEDTLFLRNFAKENNVTLFTFMLSAFAFLLTKYTNQTDIVIGIPYANRKMECLENIIGCFINTLIIRLDLSKNYNCKDLLKTASHTVLAAQENSDVLFEKLITSLHPDRDQSHNPIFQIMFAFNTKSEELEFPHIISRQIPIESNYAHMELICFIEERNNDIEGYIEYNKDLFTKDTIKRILDNYLHILKEFSHQLEQPIHELSFLSHEERKILLNNGKGIQKQYPRDKNLIQLFEEQVKKNPSKIVLFHQDQQITYNELNIRANKLAHYIQKTGVKTNGYIGVYFKRSIETIIAFLAIMKSGNAYIPFDEEAPLSLIQCVIDDAKISILLTTRRFYENAQKAIDMKQTSIISIDEQFELIQKEAITNLSCSSMKSAYVLYTSGSTGKPKGVQIAHHSLVNLMFAMRDELGFTEKDILLAITPLTFDLSVPDIYLPLIMGASFVLADTSTRFYAPEIIRHIQKNNITLMQATPTTWNMLVQENWQNETRIKIICGGEGLKTQLAAKLCAKGSPVWNFYGPTETTVWATCHKIKSVDGQKSVISIGRPLNNIEVFVLNQDEQLAPIGVTGELYIGGEAVGDGYLNNPQMTKQQFISDIFSSDKRKKLYRTGDLVVWSPKGELSYIGRIDTQIKIRGYRIETEAIETILNKHPAIFESVILDKGPKSTEQELVAYLLLKNESVSLSSIQNYLSRYFPIYMIPTKFIAIKQFPLTSNGKINRNALPNLHDFHYVIDHVSKNIPIQNSYEKHIINILKKLIKLESVDPEVNFFNLGIHSMLLVELATLLSESFSCEINVIDLFTHSTVRKLADFLINQKDKKTPDNFTTQRAAARRRKIVRRQDEYDV